MSVSLLAACESYQPMPASHEAIANALEPRQPDELARAAAELRHPLLPPVSIGRDGSLTPQGAAVVAVLANPALRAARARRGVAAAQLLQAGILPNPQLSATMDFPIAGKMDDTETAFGLGATWDVTSLIGREQALTAASQVAEAIDLEIAWQEWQAAMGAKLHATRVLWLSVQRDELAQQVREAEGGRDTAVANFKAGLTTIIESEAAGSLVQKRRAALLSAEASLVSESGQLRQALGLPQTAMVRIVADPAGRDMPLPSPHEISSRVEHHRLDLAALRAGYASQEAKLHAAVLSQFPKIGLGFLAARDDSGVGTLGFGVTMDLPIFDRGQGRIAAERATRQVLFDELAARTFEADSDAGRALAELEAIQPQMDEARRTAAQLKALAERLGDARTNGDADIVQLAQARNDGSDAAVEFIHLRQQEAELRIAFEVATGALIGDIQP